MDRLSEPRQTLRARAGGAVLALLVSAGLGAALVLGLTVDLPRAVAEQMAQFTLLPEPAASPTPTPVPPPEPVDAPEGAAAPPNLRSKATEVTAPPPVVKVPAPIPAATTAAQGSDATSGAAEVAGPGTGAGGSGSGTGAGGTGNGSGSGRELPPRRIAGRISDADFPLEARRGLRSGTVSVSYVVLPNGRATDCRIARSSGSRALDYATCELIEARFRFQPATDENGRPVRAILEEDHSWVVR